MSSADREALQLRLVNETSVAAAELHDSLPSTNSHALALARKRIATPYLVWTHEQTAGRGRGSHTWWAREGALTFSWINEVPGAGGWPVSLLAGLAVCETLKSIEGTLEPWLKWPNDVFLATRKVAGILVETVAAEQHLLVIGIGINVNNSMADAPPELQQTAVSLLDVCGRELDTTAVLVQLLNELQRVWDESQHRPDRVASRWSEYCGLRGRLVEVERAGGSRQQGRCRGIDRQGRLLLQTDQGTVALVSGSVKLVD